MPYLKNIIKTGLFPKELSKYLKKAKRTREDADYGDFVELTKDDAIIYLKNARDFVKEAEKTIQKMMRGAEN